jgi:hypothetical protein
MQSQTNTTNVGCVGKNRMGNANKKWKEKGGDGIGGAEGLLNL